MPKLLSKSKYMNGMQCPKLLWISVNAKERLPEVDESIQKRFDEGHIVGEYAKKLFPQGIDILITICRTHLNELNSYVKPKKIDKDSYLYQLMNSAKPKQMSLEEKKKLFENYENKDTSNIFRKLNLN